MVRSKGWELIGTFKWSPISEGLLRGWDCLDGQVVKTALPMQGVQVRSLVGELRSHMPRSVAKK